MLRALENGAIINIIWQLSPLAFVATVPSILAHVWEIRSGKRRNALSRRQHLASLPGVRNQGMLRHVNSRGLLTVTSYKIGSGLSLAVVLSSPIWWNVLVKPAYLTAFFLSLPFLFFFFLGDRFFIICWIHFTLSIFYRKNDGHSIILSFIWIHNFDGSL